MILDDIRVLDFTQYLAGPSITRLMAEMGAEIIKIEQAPGGDPGRLLPFVRDGRSGFFVQQNRGKKSLCLDLSTPEAKKIVLDLVREVDIVVENAGPGVMEKRGFDYTSLAGINPRLIMASVSAFGRQSTLSHKTGYDWIVQGFSGLMDVTGPRGGTPHPVGIGVCDSNAGVHGFAAIGYALYHRLRTGEGQYLDLSMVDTMFHMHEYNVHGRSVIGKSFRPGPMGAHHELVAPFGVFKGPTGFLVIAVLQLQWKGLCEAMGCPELAEDARFIDGETRARHQETLIEMIESWTASFETNEAVLEVLEAHRVPAGPVLNPTDALEHEYFLDRGTVRTVTDPILGEIQIPGFPFRFSAQPDLPDFEAPLLGQHNAEVLSSVLGYGADRIDELRDVGTLVSADK